MSGRSRDFSCGVYSEAWTERLEADAERGIGLQEIRIHGDVEHRVLYVAKFVEAVYVLHAFEKRTRRTPKEDLSLAQQRFRSLINQRARGKG